MDLEQLIKHPELMDKETLYDLRSLLALYPYFQTARLLLLQNLYLLHDPSFDEELRRSAVYVADREVVFNLVEAAHYKLRQSEKRKDGVKPEAAEGGDANRTISLIEAMRGQDLIDNFINNDKGKIELKDKPEYVPEIDGNEKKEGDENYFTETLAQIYIKQGRYSKALEIIKRLNLNYPKKNAYFADQIRFLEKLIINNKCK